MQSDLWLEEKYKNFIGYRYKIKNTLFSGKSEFQSVDVVETEGLGKMLLNDGLVMVTEKDEFVYHDMITHVPMFTHPNPENVLIIGGGDGGTAREVLRHKSVKKCVMVEIDKMVVDACLEHIPQTSKDLSHPKLELIIDDGLEYVKNTSLKFDVILIDSTDPIGPAAPLFNSAFYKNVKKCLTPNGIVVSQGESVFFESHMQQILLGILGEHFSKVSIYNYSNLTYPGGLWSFTYASDALDPIKNFNESRVQTSKMKFNYYNEQIHKAAFALPSFMREKVQHLLK
jgi:spermidine synthase